MGSEQEAELRRLVAHGLGQVNEHHGGRYLSTIARQLGVDRTTVTRWVHGRTTASIDHCRSLADRYPDAFEKHRLVELHALTAVADGQGTSSALTVGADVLQSAADVHHAAAAALMADPGPPENRVCRLASLHLDRRGIDSVSEDPLMDEDSVGAVMAFRQAMTIRATEGWKIRNVFVARNLARLEGLEHLVRSLDGPDIEIRVYPMTVPLVLSPLIVANREVFLAFDHRRWERPHSALMLHSQAVVQWATDYFDQLFLDAPHTVRDVHGPNQAGLAAVRAAMTTDGS